MRFHAPYMEWAKKRPSATYDLAGSNVLACTIDDLAGARDALTLSGNSDNGYTPLAYAAMKGSVPMLDLLLRNGADASQLTKEGDTPVELALRMGHAEAADLLKRARMSTAASPAPAEAEPATQAGG